MRTTLEIDEQLLEATVRYTGQTHKEQGGQRGACRVLPEGSRPDGSYSGFRANLDLDLDDWYEVRHIPNMADGYVIPDT